MPFPVESVWNDMLSDIGSVDICAGIEDSSINAFLKAHHKGAGGYTLPIVKRFKSASGPVREFHITVRATKPFVVDIHPFKVPASGDSPWNEVPAPDDLPTFVVPDADSLKPNVRLSSESVAFEITWPKLADPDGKPWSFPLELDMEARAFVSLSTDEVGQTNKEDKTEESYNRAFLQIHPTHARFSQSREQVVQALLRATTGMELTTHSEDDQKFIDLLVILLNTLATEFAPRVAQRLEIPTPIFSNLKIVPAAITLHQNFIGAGLSIDRVEARSTVQKKVASYIAGFEAALEMDFARNGGMARTVLKNVPAIEQVQEDPDSVVLEFHSEAELESRMPLATAYLNSLRELTARADLPGTESGPLQGPLNMQAWAAVRQGFIRDIMASALPDHTSECTGWLNLVGVRGRACYWARLTDPRVEVQSNGGVRGGLAVDAGGGLEACIRRFWDCSWRWSCGSAGLRTDDRGELTLFVRKSKGIELALRQASLPAIKSTGVPFPFDKVIDGILGLFGRFLQVLVNAALLFVRIRISAPSFAPANEGWAATFSLNQAFRYARPLQGTSEDEKHYLGVHVASVLTTNATAMMRARAQTDDWAPVLGLEPGSPFTLLSDADGNFEARGKRSEKTSDLKAKVVSTSGSPEFSLSIYAELLSGRKKARVKIEGSLGQSNVDIEDGDATVDDTVVGDRRKREIRVKAGGSIITVVALKRGGRHFEISVTKDDGPSAVFQGYGRPPRSRLLLDDMSS